MVDRRSTSAITPSRNFRGKISISREEKPMETPHSSRIRESKRKSVVATNETSQPKKYNNEELQTPVSKRVASLRHGTAKTSSKKSPSSVKKVEKLRVRKSLILRGRETINSRKSENDSDNDNSSLSTPLYTRQSRRTATTGIASASMAQTKKRKSISAQKCLSEKKPLKVTIRKSVIRRGREAAATYDYSDHSTSDEEMSEPIIQETEHFVPLKNREKEFEQIDGWIRNSFLKKDPLTLYISGSPGTGKTATIQLVLKKWKSKASSTIINCVSVKVQKDLIEAIFSSQECSKRPTLSNLESFLTQLDKPLILVLDEIDHLSNNSNSLLYCAFKWPQQLSSKLMVIGIANSIDLTERLLPKLKLCHPPKTLVFAPYTKDNIREILEDKMNKEDSKLDAKAVELCARKVAAMSGDLRTALHVVKTTKASALASGLDETSNGCREVLGVLNTVYSSPLARARLPLQPRLLLAVCLCMSSNKKSNLTTTSIFSGYMKACEAIKVPPLESDDLTAAFQTLESQSFISTASNGHVRLQVDSKTARGVISDRAMIDQIGILNL